MVASPGVGSQPAAPRTVDVPFERVAGWIERFDSRHADTTWTVTPNAVTAASADGSSVAFIPPIGALETPTLAGLINYLEHPWKLGLILVRRGGFGVARLVGREVVDIKVGQRHVQGRTKAGGWSQQRFARRRDNQARAAYDAAAGYVRQILLPYAGGLDLIVTGGDRAAVEAVLTSRGLAPLGRVPTRWLPGIADPRRDVVDRAVVAARSVTITVTDNSEP